LGSLQRLLGGGLRRDDVYFLGRKKACGALRASAANSIVPRLTGERLRRAKRSVTYGVLWREPCNHAHIVSHFAEIVRKMGVHALRRRGGRHSHPIAPRLLGPIHGEVGAF
jgi:hypothetical protein